MPESFQLEMFPAPGERVLRYVGDRFRVTLRQTAGSAPAGDARALLRTDLGRGAVLRREIIHSRGGEKPMRGASWRDVPMQRCGDEWRLEFTLTEVGYFKAKAFVVDEHGWQVWPDGPDVGISVHPDAYRTANTIYCAFTRLLGDTRFAISTADRRLEAQLRELDRQGYAVIPASGKLRDLARQLPHIIDGLGCRILHLLPVNPTPTTFARFGRFGSPYAGLDLTAIDPALIEFDRRTTGVEQFGELASAVHRHGARLFLDLVINHTGWSSTLHETHPEWFLRGPDGAFVCPGAWGVTWEDLVELEPQSRDLWDHLAEAFLTWCRRGVDGFRCDAGYKVPMPVWQYIVARVREEFPGTLFLLEGLGGGWNETEKLLTEGGMQWAYSELFQELTGPQVAGYLDHAHKQSGRVGVLVHYSETHDNDRLAKKSRAWSLLRNRMSALTSVSGAYGFTCGVEWLATEKIRVHGCTGLAWGDANNLVPELSQLNRLLASHPCFFDSARLTRLSDSKSPVFALRRDSADGRATVLVLANTSATEPNPVMLDASELKDFPIERAIDLLGQPAPKTKRIADGKVGIELERGACYCLAAVEAPTASEGETYRRARARAAWALDALSEYLEPEEIGPFDWRALAGLVDQNPRAVLAALERLDPEAVRTDPVAALTTAISAKAFPRVIEWTLLDRQRVIPVPPVHWLLLRDTVPFRATLRTAGGALNHLESIPVHDGHAGCFAPRETGGTAELTLERFADAAREVRAMIQFLDPLPPACLAAKTQPGSPDARDAGNAAAQSRLVLLTNGRGGMARICVDLGRVQSKYDCLLAANLHPAIPVDRHVFAKRARVWANCDGFIAALNADNLCEFDAGPPARWRFIASAGDGRTATIELTARMPEGKNTTVLNFRQLPADSGGNVTKVRLTVRVDIEDRSFHGETKRNGAAEYHFSTNTRPLTDASGFAFTPAEDRQLRVFSDAGRYHHAPEWCEHIEHPVEASRGQVASGDAFSPGWFDLPLEGGKTVPLFVTAERSSSRDEAEPSEVKTPDSELGPSLRPPADAGFTEKLVRAAQAFVVRRGEGKTVIAGYPWFLDWGRDTLICARGLLSAGMLESVRQILVTFARFEDRGTLPNTILGDNASNRDTSDAPLWFGIACEEADQGLAGTGNLPPLASVVVNGHGRTITDVLRSIATHYRTGTPNGIRMDPGSGLIWSPSHFTWMDTNHPAGTPREGYPIEIQALWIRLLRQLGRLEGRAADWVELADRAEASLQKFYWLEDRGYYADGLLAETGEPAAAAEVDTALRSNCLFPVSLGLARGDRARRCVVASQRHLVVPGALRSLAPLPVSPPLPIRAADGRLLNHPVEPYWSRYEGDEDTRRKPAYHNGTAWTWTFPVFCEALACAWDCAPEAISTARSYLGSMEALMDHGCVGQLPEILDGDAPHQPRGCDAQAWGATEALRVWKWLTALARSD